MDSIDAFARKRHLLSHYFMNYIHAGIKMDI